MNGETKGLFGARSRADQVLRDFSLCFVLPLLLSFFGVRLMPTAGGHWGIRSGWSVARFDSLDLVLRNCRR